MAPSTLGERLCTRLAEHGVRTVFGIPGVHNLGLYRGLDAAGLTHILPRHEQGAGFMADGYARATGRPGVAFTISGPGMTNVLTPLAQANSDTVPVLVLSSCLDDAETRAGQLHQMPDQLGAARAACDHAAQARTPEAAYWALDEAFDRFASQRPRASYLQVPIRALSQTAPLAPAPRGATPRPRASAAQIDAVAAMLADARRPVIILGGGVALAGASAPARQVIRDSGAAVFTTYAGRGTADAGGALFLGSTLARPSSAAVLAEADLVMAVGTELAEVDLWRDHPGHGCPLIRVDIDPDVLASLPAELAIRGDARAFLTELAAALTPVETAWDPARLAEMRAAWRAEVDAERPGVAPWVDALMAALPRDALVYSDMTQFAYVAKEICAPSGPGQWHHPYGFGTLGYALPAAIGGKIGLPERPVVAVAGDYGFQFTQQELAVAAELGLNLPVLIWDNGGLSEISRSMTRAGMAPAHVTAHWPDFAALAAAYGSGYVQVSGPGDLGVAIGAALGRNRPTLVHMVPAVSSSS